MASQNVDRPREFDEMVLEHTDMMYAVALRLTRNVADAQDLTQNAIVKALRFHAKFQKGTYIKAWLLTILRNTFINDYRRKQRRPMNVELTGAEAARYSLPDPDVNYDPPGENYRDLIELLDDTVVQAIERLPEEFRLAVIMADIEDKSYKAIAEAMDCPMGTVMSRLYRGRKLLREELKDFALERGLGRSRATESSVAVLE
ncbi:MAG: sigma-70 family RNA polymerase sigma factor [Candidatus Hydrogenedentes bacterium]|nr:sigma-70 family RNA polymerase sigma factor [Candidatus Hydrogenedentota bacterium]